jgi:hypothetical protein
MERSIDHLDEWAERTFGKKTHRTKRVIIRDANEKSVDQEKFDSLFKKGK